MTATTLRLGAVLAALTICLAAWGGSAHNYSPSFKSGAGQRGLPGEATHGEAAIAARRRPYSQRTTFLLSSANGGGVPNGPSRNAAVSHDQRIARYIAYESDASNIVGGDTNGKTDVFLVSRAKPYGQNGTPWKPAGTNLISRGKGGQPANGSSYGPAVDGDSNHLPHCVAFVSAASNLVRGDTNGKPDGFVYNTRTQKIRRVTVGRAGAQANGSTYGISISGDCNRVAFTSDATNLAGRSSKRQVYVHVLGGSTFLASAANNGAAGNGDSQDAVIARSGKAVAFASTATNLSKGDGTASSDVYRRTISPSLRGTVGLVSAGASGSAGNGASSHPAISDDGRYVAFATDASNLLPGDTNGVSDIARADMKSGKPTQEWVSKTAIGGIANGASHNPAISDAGQFVLFDSDATNLRPSRAVRADANGVRDVFLWNEPTRNVSLESRDANNGYLHSPSQHPATSSHGNYVAFESGGSLAAMPMGALPQLPNMNIPQMPGLPQMPKPAGMPQLPKGGLPQLPQLPKLPGVPQMPGLPQLPKGLPGVQMPKLPGFGKARRSASINGVAGAAASGSEQVYLRYLGPK